VDELLVYMAPCILGDPARGVAEFAAGLARLSDRIALTFHDVARVGEDLRVVARVGRPKG
jgi:diaminohydroxyphosphoribosylaminopyrimidine deaminase/5-amino-6-(5-phosphoribosylamino)uracil reductase